MTHAGNEGKFLERWK